MKKADYRSEIEKARSLQDLCRVLNEAEVAFIEAKAETLDREDHETAFLLDQQGLAEFMQVDMADLPVFDNEDWNNPWGVWSWDETSVLVPTYAAPGDPQWELIKIAEFREGARE